MSDDPGAEADDVERPAVADWISDDLVDRLHDGELADVDAVVGQLANPATVFTGIELSKLSTRIIDAAIDITRDIAEEGCAGAGPLVADAFRAGYALGRHWVGDLESTWDVLGVPEAELDELVDEVADAIIDMALSDDRIFDYAPNDLAEATEALYNAVLAARAADLASLPDEDAGTFLGTAIRNGLLAMAVDWSHLYR